MIKFQTTLKMDEAHEVKQNEVKDYFIDEIKERE